MKSKLFKFLTILLIIFLSQCSTKKIELTKTKPKISLEKLYTEAYKNFEDGKFQNAVDLFLMVETEYGYTEWAAKSLLFRSFIYYDLGRYVESLENLKKYKKLYSADKNIIYADYLTSICVYEQIGIKSKDQKNTLLAKKLFTDFIKKYPNTDYSYDLKLKLDLINDQLAGNEMYIARYYQERKKWLAALKRLSNILENYQSTIYIEEALHRMVEIHYKIGNIESAKKFASILGYNFNESDWYKKSYTIISSKNFNIIDIKRKKRLREKLKALIN